MTSRFALITQSYKADLNECRLLCESIDKFAPNIDHIIFVNDEDESLFAALNYGRHKVVRKGVLLPRTFVRLPWKIAGHHFHISPFTLPIREWIVQQICKLAVFEYLGADYDAVFHLDSELVFMRPLNVDEWVKNGRYMMYRVDNVNEPSHDEYCNAAEALLPIDKGMPTTRQFNYMCQPTCFQRANLQEMLRHIRKRNLLRNWKYALSNTYRFSEYYLYNIFTDNVLNSRNHFHISVRPFSVVDISLIHDSSELGSEIRKQMSQPGVTGLCLQKRERKNLAAQYLPANIIESTIKQIWNEQAD